MYTGNMERTTFPVPPSMSIPSRPSIITVTTMQKAAEPRRKEGCQTFFSATSVSHTWAMLQESTAILPTRTYSHAGFHHEKSAKSRTPKGWTPGEATSATPQ